MEHSLFDFGGGGTICDKEGEEEGQNTISYKQLFSNYIHIRPFLGHFVGK